MTDERRRWLILVVGLLAMTATCMFQFGFAYLIPALRADGFSLEQAGVLVACPTAGGVLTLIAWGAAADRWGERVVLATGLAVAGLVLVAARWVHGTVTLAVCLVLAGAAAASVLASGRLILGWFARRERGLAMGIRQMSQPIGIGLAAAILPTLGAGGLGVPLLFLGVCLLAASAAVAVLVRDPERPPPGPGRTAGAASPYRTPVLWRIHAASALLVVPQSTVGTFALIFLTDARGWTAVGAGQLLAGAQVFGALARLGAGAWSDRTGSRIRPIRILAVTTGAGMLALAAAAAAGSRLAVPVLLFLGVVVVSTNGLSFTAVGEYAGLAWAGRALGVQTTGQNTVGAGTPPVLAVVIAGAGFGPAFAAVAVFPLLAAILVPAAADARNPQPTSVRAAG
ncbi:MFS transporter [Jidongwangia harbinensis]|uniref:MFS transporter n=1 Tax=Jidongwangia harbinensis TaxID=2878561 RepID=UPI001CD922E9|nr:MFS transporter [Jidongwangia harbinensis]MCA2218749.1 MFS transporter [Jidongwangia harbinensis]